MASDTFTSAGCYSSCVRDALDIEALCRQYGAMVLRRCRRLLAEEDEALDAWQDVFVRLVEHRDRLAGTYPSSLLYRIATNVCLNRIRDRKRAPITLTCGSCLDREPGTTGGQKQRPAANRLAVRRHPESSRTIAVLHCVDGLTLEGVARVTDQQPSRSIREPTEARGFARKSEDSQKC